MEQDNRLAIKDVIACDNCTVASHAGRHFELHLIVSYAKGIIAYCEHSIPKQPY